jgi:hypothetical protein
MPGLDLRASLWLETGLAALFAADRGGTEGVGAPGWGGGGTLSDVRCDLSESSHALSRP